MATIVEHNGLAVIKADEGEMKAAADEFFRLQSRYGEAAGTFEDYFGSRIVVDYFGRKADVRGVLGRL